MLVIALSIPPINENAFAWWIQRRSNKGRADFTHLNAML
jgi:hypothetical protein